MFGCMPPTLVALVFSLAFPVTAIPKVRFTSLSTISSQELWSKNSKRSDGINFNPNGSTFLWLPEDVYSGETFFDNFDFFTGADPTDGLVNYVDKDSAIQKNYTIVQADGTVIMKADDITSLPLGTNRDSVRIQSQKQYNTALMILDLNQAPWGCGVWPAFWTVGPDWPNNGEIDIIEGVHDNEHNQITWHTATGCLLNPNGSFTGTVVNTNNLNSTNCDGNLVGNPGCGTIEWSRASYGPFFDSQAGGVFAMKWDENSISVWSFYRAAIPKDILDGTPSPATWGMPDASLDTTSCNIPKFFANQSIVFDITFCGQWAGNTYATTPGCPGTCPERLMDPTNFQNASWSINSLKVYRKQLFTGHVVNSGNSAFPRWGASIITISIVLALILLE